MLEDGCAPVGTGLLRSRKKEAPVGTLSKGSVLDFGLTVNETVRTGTEIQ